MNDNRVEIVPVFVPDDTQNEDGTMNEPKMREFLLGIGIPDAELDGIIIKMMNSQIVDYEVYPGEASLNVPDEFLHSDRSDIALFNYEPRGPQC